MPTCQAAVNSMVKSGERGAANSTYLFSYDLGIGVGSLVIGFLLDKVSLEVIYRYSYFFDLNRRGYICIYGNPPLFPQQIMTDQKVASG